MGDKPTLAERNATLAARVKNLGERIATLTARVGTLTDRLARAQAELKACRERFDAPSRTDESFEHLLERGNIVINERLLANHFDVLRENLPPERVQAYAEYLKADDYKPLYRQLFGPEIQLSNSLSPFTLQPYHNFLMGSEVFERRGPDVTPEELAGAKFALIDRLLNAILPNEIFQREPRRIVEIGGAWGATIRHFKQRFEVDVYLNYEIDRAYAEWAERTLNAKAMPCDGETLLGTADDSMDLAVANAVLFILGPLKAFSYLQEMGRVVAPGGLLAFNIELAEGMTADLLSNRLTRTYPRRSWSSVPQHYIDLALPAERFELLAKHADGMDGVSPSIPYFIYRKR